MIEFILGLIVGGSIGFIMCAIFVATSGEDEPEE